MGDGQFADWLAVAVPVRRRIGLGMDEGEGEHRRRPREWIALLCMPSARQPSQRQAPQTWHD